MVRSTQLWVAFCALAMLAGGCAETSTDEAGASIGALDLGPTVVVARDVWEPLPAGCDEMLPLTGVTITGAAGAPGLRVAIDGQHALCADSAAGMLDALNTADLTPVREGLTSPIHAFPRWVLDRHDTTAGDPSPQPSQPRINVDVVPVDAQGQDDGSPTAGDPSPQPSQPKSTTANSNNGGNEMMMGGPTQGDPSPQPSQPRNATHVGM